MKKLLLCFLFLVFTAIAANASVIGDFGVEKIQGIRSSSGFAWNYSYDLSFQNQDLVLEIDIHLTGADASLIIPGYDLGAATLLEQWEKGIEGIWSSAFDIFDGSYLYDTVFNVNWVPNTGTQDHTVEVIAGNGHTNMLQWYTDEPAGWPNIWHDEIAAHEFGHMFGLYDEYDGGAVDPVTHLVGTGSIMDNLGDPSALHYADLVSWLVTKSDRDLSLLPDSGDHYYNDIAPVPEPATIFLFGLGILGLAGIQRRK